VNTTLAIVSSSAFWAAVIATAAPLLLGTIGALVSGRAGVLPLAAEGILAAGAVCAIVVVRGGHSPWIALVLAIAAGAAIGFAQAALVMPFGLPPRLAGVALLLATLGGAHVLLVAEFPGAAANPLAVKIAAAGIDLRVIGDLPHVGATLREVLRQPLTVHIALLAVLASAHGLMATPLGLALRACGDSPAAVAAQGRSVAGLRIYAGTVGAALMGLAAGSLALAEGAAMPAGRIDGRGFLWLALAAAARWQPVPAAALAVAAAILNTALAAAPALGGPLPLLPLVLALVILAATRGDPSRPFAGKRA